MTGKPAAVLGLSDRGRIARGMVADLVVFDPGEFESRAGMFTPNELAAGVTDLFVNGVATMLDGTPTGARAGRVIRGRGG